MKGLLTSQNSDHGCNSERDTHGKDIDNGNAKNDDMPPPSRIQKEVLEKPTGIAERGTCLKKKHQVNDTDGKNDSSPRNLILEHVIFKSSIEDGDDDDNLPISDAFLKRRAAKTDAAAMHLEKRKCKTLRIEEMLGDQNVLQCERTSHPEGCHNIKDQLNEQCDSKIMESNAMDAEPAQGHQITQEGDVLQTTSQVQNASQTEGHNDVTDQITRQSRPLTTSLIAAYLLVLNSYKNVFHLNGGLNTWFKEGLPVIEAEE